MTYAADTKVPIEKSKSEIEAILRRAGADQFVSGWDADRAMIQFRMNRFIVRYVVPIPTREEAATTPKGRPRSGARIDGAHEQIQRQRWRALKLIIQAKLEAVESGVTTFEREFLSDIVLDTGENFADWAIPQLKRLYESGTPMTALPIMLPAPGEKP